MCEFTQRTKFLCFSNHLTSVHDSLWSCRLFSISRNLQIPKVRKWSLQPARALHVRLRAMPCPRNSSRSIALLNIARPSPTEYWHWFCSEGGPPTTRGKSSPEIRRSATGVELPPLSRRQAIHWLLSSAKEEWMSRSGHAPGHQPEPCIFGKICTHGYPHF